MTGLVGGSAPVLTDGEVVLRAPGLDDLAGVLEQFADPVTARWTPAPVPFGPVEALELVRDIVPAMWADGSQAFFAVLAGGRYAGTVALVDEGHGRASVSYGAHPAARGTGVLERAVRLLLDWAFAERGVETVVWRCEAGNWASRKLAWRVGFTVDGVLRHSHPSRGRLVDAWVGTLLADEPREPAGRWLVLPELSGDGVRLRAVAERDVPRVVEACTDPVTQHWLGRMPASYDEHDARTWMATHAERLATGTAVTWAVAAADTDDLLAAVNLFDITERHAEIGYWSHPAARGRGAVAAAVRLVTGWAFAELGLRRVRIVCAVDNVASRRVAEACGYRGTGRERLGTELRDGLADIVRYDVPAEEWPTDTGSGA
ncbi:GNAT family N-acetyltransferase [Nocardioides litoris]|uniref:GNAT family N-acetyltransferase n=1 Tax=Nocardioides litoris TaxID=1926648 RepID=UPI0011240B2E|nr:GNAT family protein [Nocardioides litoris]